MAEETRGPLLYRPPQAWYFWGAFGAALAIHLTAVAIAQKHEQPAELPPDIPTAVIEATLQATTNLRRHQKIFLCRSRRRRPTSSRSMWKRQPLHQRNLRIKNSRPLRRRKPPVGRARCRSLQPKLWQPMRRVLNIHMRRVHDTLRAAEHAWLRSVQAAA